jgi:hypothetical protein
LTTFLNPPPNCTLPEDLCPVAPKTPTYKVHCRWTKTDLSLKDHWWDKPDTDGKPVDTGSWEYSSDSLDHVMAYCEDLFTAGTTLDPENPHIQYSYEFEVHRTGLPLLILSWGHWSAIGDDYLDPYVDETTEELFILEALDIDPVLALTNF